MQESTSPYACLIHGLLCLTGDGALGQSPGVRHIGQLSLCFSLSIFILLCVSPAFPFLVFLSLLASQLNFHMFLEVTSKHSVTTKSSLYSVTTLYEFFQQAHTSNPYISACLAYGNGNRKASALSESIIPSLASSCTTSF